MTYKNIKDFLEGNFKYYYNAFVSAPTYMQEQLTYRYNLCKGDCLVDNECIICKCPPLKKHFLTTSCNPERFPNLMIEEDWNKFKETLDENDYKELHN